MYLFIPFITTLVSGFLGFIVYKFSNIKIGTVVTLITSILIAYIFTDLYAFFGVLGGLLFYFLLIKFSK
ncbi:hypothetical protein P364_0116595 [Paenibacillus sp. MAEPY2]|nr:hypothetical protein P363_0133150 [Paenibacillus sp. MAEPY1]KGP81449.1 hypothetical protein P364_0116595 [Paenibacillus sp. MAEPY2]